MQVGFYELFYYFALITNFIIIEIMAISIFICFNLYINT